MGNWFVALEAPPEGWFDRVVVDVPPRVRRFHPEDLHLTVAFFGAAGEERARRGWAASEAFALTAQTISLGPVVPMGNPRRYSALSALVANGHGALASEMGRTRDAILDAAGARLDDRPPKPHLTVARPQRKASPADRDRALAWGRALPTAGVEIPLTHLALYAHGENRAERLFRVVERRPLA